MLSNDVTERKLYAHNIEFIWLLMKLFKLKNKDNPSLDLHTIQFSFYYGKPFERTLTKTTISQLYHNILILPNKALIGMIPLQITYTPSSPDR